MIAALERLRQRPAAPLPDQFAAFGIAGSRPRCQAAVHDASAARGADRGLAALTGLASLADKSAGLCCREWAHAFDVAQIASSATRYASSGFDATCG